MKTLLLLLLFAIPCIAQEAPTLKAKEIPQEPEKCVHETEKDFYESIRHSGIVQITVVTGREVTVVHYYNSPPLIEHHTYYMNPHSRVPKDFYKVDLKRRWFLLICIKHNVLLVAEPIK